MKKEQYTPEIKAKMKAARLIIKERSCNRCGKKFMGNSHQWWCSDECKFYKDYIKSQRFCVLCKTEDDLHEHHIQMKKYGGEETIVLCLRCHHNLHRFYTYMEQKGYCMMKIPNN